MLHEDAQAILERTAYRRVRCGASRQCGNWNNQERLGWQAGTVAAVAGTRAERVRDRVRQGDGEAAILHVGVTPAYFHIALHRPNSIYSLSMPCIR